MASRSSYSKRQPGCAVNQTVDTPPSGEHVHLPRMTLGARLRAYFFAGILITAPISITLYLAWLFIAFIDSKVTPLIPEQYNPEHYLPFTVPGLGLVILVVFLTLVGALTAGFVGRQLTRLYEGILQRMPVVSGIYSAVKQVVETIFSQKSNAFRDAVLIEYPRKGIWTIAFLTGTTTGEIQRRTDEETVNVFVPTTPNPTSGFLLFLPKRDIVPLEMSVEDALKMVISGGIVTPPDGPRLVKNGRKALAAEADKTAKTG